MSQNIVDFQQVSSLRDVKSNVIPWATVLAVAFGMMLVVLVSCPLAILLSISTDEAFALHTTNAGPVYAWTQAIYFEAQPPLYFVLESIWRLLNESSIAFGRVPSIIFAVLTIGVIVLAAKSVAPRINSLIVAAIAALNPIVIWAAVEMRVYALVLLVGAVLTWTFIEGFLIPNFKIKLQLARIGYIIFAIVGLYTQYYVGFILLAHFITLAIVRRKTLIPFIGSMAIVSVVFAPFIGIVKLHMTHAGDMDMITDDSFLHIIHEFVNMAFVFILPHNEGWSGIWKIIGFVIIALLMIALFTLGKPIMNKMQFQVILQWALSIAIFIAIFDVVGVPRSFLRHVIVLAPACIIVAFMLMSSLTKYRMPLYIAIVLVFAGFSSTEFWNQYRPPTSKPGDWKNVATFVSQDKSIPVAIFPAELALGPQAYLSPDVTIVPVPKPVHFEFDYISSLKLNSEVDVANALNSVYLHNKSNELLIITLSTCHEPNPEGINLNCVYFDSYLNKRYDLVKSTQFKGSLVRLYAKKHK